MGKKKKIAGEFSIVNFIGRILMHLELEFSGSKPHHICKAKARTTSCGIPWALAFRPQGSYQQHVWLSHNSSLMSMPWHCYNLTISGCYGSLCQGQIIINNYNNNNKNLKYVRFQAGGRVTSKLLWFMNPQLLKWMLPMRKGPKSESQQDGHTTHVLIQRCFPDKWNYIYVSEITKHSGANICTKKCGHSKG